MLKVRFACLNFHSTSVDSDLLGGRLDIGDIDFVGTACGIIVVVAETYAKDEIFLYCTLYSLSCQNSIYVFTNSLMSVNQRIWAALFTVSVLSEICCCYSIRGIYCDGSLPPHLLITNLAVIFSVQ